VRIIFQNFQIAQNPFQNIFEQDLSPSAGRKVYAKATEKHIDN
jgi:hypothetical protein